MPPKPTRSADRPRRPRRTDPPGPDPLDLAERLFGPDPSRESRARGDGDEQLGMRPERVWVRLLGFELPWRRRKRRS